MIKQEKQKRKGNFISRFFDKLRNKHRIEAIKTENEILKKRIDKADKAFDKAVKESRIAINNIIGATLKPSIGIVVCCHDSNNVHMDDTLRRLVSLGYTNIEVVCLCTDDVELSSDIANNNRIKVVKSKKNSDAALYNESLHHITSDWVMFIDAGDYVDKDIFNSLLYDVVHDADLVAFGARSYGKMSEEQRVLDIERLKVGKDGLFNVNEDIFSNINNINLSSKLLKRSLIERCKITFHEEVANFRELFFILYLVECENVFCDSRVLITLRLDSVLENQTIDDHRNMLLVAEELHTELKRAGRLSWYFHFFIAAYYHILDWELRYGAEKDAIRAFAESQKHLYNITESEVDLVYTWVDGSDPAWIEKKSRYSEPSTQTVTDSAACRFISNDELRYSLRSVEMYAPWIRKIFIVTDSQVPSFVNTKHPKIHIVDHKDIVEHKYLPTFNSTVIEANIDKIEGLSEHFLLANDDMFFLNPCSPAFFFNKHGVANAYIKKSNLLSVRDTALYFRKIYRAFTLIREKYDYAYDGQYIQYHCIDSYNKSTIKECKEVYKKEVELGQTFRFRNELDLQRSLFSFYSIVKKQPEVVTRYNMLRNQPLSVVHYINALVAAEPKPKVRKSADAQILSVNNADKLKMDLTLSNPVMSCFNDNEFVTESDRIKCRQLYDELFPNVSSFEI